MVIILPNKENLPKFIAIALLITLGINILLSFISQSAFQEIDYSTFLRMLDNDEIYSVQIAEDRIIIIPKADSATPIVERKMYYTGKLDYPGLVDRLYDAGVKFKPVQNKQSPIMNFLISWVLPFGIFYLFASMLMGSMSKRMGGTMSIGKSNAKVYVQKVQVLPLMMWQVKRKLRNLFKRLLISFIVLANIPR